MPIDRSKEPAIKQIGSFSLPKLEQIRLDNGIPVYVLNTGDQQVTKLDLIMKGGRWRATSPPRFFRKAQPDAAARK